MFLVCLPDFKLLANIPKFWQIFLKFKGPQDDYYDYDSLSKAEIIELIEAKTKFIEAKCLSKAEIIELIEAKTKLIQAKPMRIEANDCSKNPCQKGQGKNTAD